MNTTAPAQAASTGEVALRVESLGRQFAGVKAVDGVTLSVSRGARLGIIGPNGAGKTTFFNMLSGELKPTSGRIEMFGQDVTRLPAHRRVALGLGRTYQVTRVLHGLTVRENLTVAVHGLSRSKLGLLRSWRAYRRQMEQVEELAASFGLENRLDVLAEALSHGEVRQLDVCLALALKPSILLLDEPAAGLSPAERVDIRALLNRLPPELTLILIEHDMDVLRSAVDEIAVLHHGEYVARGSVAEIQQNELVRELYLGKQAEGAELPKETALNAGTESGGGLV
ncbi:ABC transporter ATP-binding protein [Planosporangium flavigriseum]|uniref:ABC transporter ATP-binding protein n=1 Tax=Planosporangium flavigriseum TaxID=373681 RepID=A0A8J3PM33_9ACTN|nr:ABC transporter ATP-binding protein [Planosporangium flavigriseum]NJC63114.1 ABC transporter ATP-binding protein [Planosporangium flavigriseum]GIG74492.1 ABC transporter ATP-binding protein [Planosporangium flavigriseum]